MYSPQEIFNNSFIELDEKWIQLGNPELGELERLYQETIPLILDVSQPLNCYATMVKLNYFILTVSNGIHW